MKCFPCIDAGGYRGFEYKSGSKYHLGHDFNCPFSSSVHAIADGEVIYSKLTGGFGSFGGEGGVIVIRHEDRFENKFLALYGHVTMAVKKGHNVKKGDILGYIIKYETGKFRADHLHFGINTHADKLPGFPWGYDKNLKGWVNPIEYICNHL